MEKTYILIIIFGLLCSSCMKSQNKEMFIYLKDEIEQSNNKLKIGESASIEIKNTANADLYIISSAYISENYIRKKGKETGINDVILKKIYKIANSQDGIYFLVVRNGKVTAFTELGPFVNISEPCLFIKAKNVNKFLLEKTDKKWRPLILSPDRIIGE